MTNQTTILDTIDNTPQPKNPNPNNQKWFIICLTIILILNLNKPSLLDTLILIVSSWIE